MNTLIILLRHYQEYLEKLPLSGNTKRAYISRVKQFLAFVSVRQSTIEEESIDWKRHICEYRQRLIRSQYQPGTINDILTAITHFLLCVEENAPKIDRELDPFREQAWLTEIQCEKFLSVVWNTTNDRNRTIALLMLFSGLRVGECAELQLGDLSITDSAVSVRLPGRSANDIVRLVSPAAGALARWLLLRECIVSSEARDPAMIQHVFISRKGKPMSKRGIDYIIRRLGWSANLDISSEKLRRSGKNLQVVGYENRGSSDKLWFQTGLVNSLEGARS